MKVVQLLKEMAERNASDVFYRVGGPVRLKIDGSLVPLDNKALTEEDLEAVVEELTTPLQREAFKAKLDVDFAVYIKELNMRFRVSVFMQRNCPSIVIRKVSNVVQTFEELNLPSNILKKLCLEKRGLVLLTGTMGSGKSTTIASMVEYINRHTKKHILTIEEPIEHTFEDKECLINQRELGIDVLSYEAALRAFTLQSPDVIFLGNIRDYKTMASAITIAETGVLVLSTLHTINAAQSVERMINFFPTHQHQEVRNQLSVLLKAVISLRLVPLKTGQGRIPAYEMMLLTPTISSLIRENRIHQIPKFIAEGDTYGMQTFNQSLVKLIRANKITEQQAIEFSDSKDELSQALQGIIRRELM